MTDNSVVLPVGNNDASRNELITTLLSDNDIGDIIYRVAICMGVGPIIGLGLGCNS